MEIDLREGGSVKGRLVEFGKRVYRVEVDGKVVEIEERSVREVRFPGHAKAAAPVVRRASEAAAKAFGHGNRAVRLALSADGKRLLTAGESENGDLKTTSVVLWDASSLAATGHCEKIRTFDERASRNAEGKETEVERVLLMPDGKRAVTGTHDARIQIWDLETGKLLRTFVHDEKWSLSSIALSRDGRFLASAAADGRITLWDVDGAREITTTTTIDANSLALDFSPEGKRLLAVRKQGVVSVLDVAAAVEGKGLVEVATLDGHQRMIWAGGFLPDGRHAFSCDDEGVLYHWDVENREVASTCLGTGRLLPTVAISPDGTRALVSGAVSDMIKLYDIEAGRELRAFHVPGGAGSIAFLPDGRHAILGGWRKGTLQLLDLGSDEPAEQRARRLPFNPFADARAGDWIVYEGSEALTARISPVTIGRIDSESVTLSFPAAANGSRPRTVPPFADESDGSTVIVVDETTKVGDREVPCKKVMVVVPGRIKHTMWLSPLVPTGIVRGESRNLAGTDDLVFHVAGYGNGEKATWGKTIEEATAAGRGKKTVRVPAEIAQRVDALLGEIDKDVKATSLDALPQKFAELDRLMRWYEKLADDDEARAKLASWNKKLEDWKEIRQALKLDTALQIGNQCLLDMIAAKREVRFEDLVATFEEVRSLVSVMKEEKREEFDRNADAIFTRAKKILEEARAERESAPPPPPPK